MSARVGAFWWFIMSNCVIVALQLYYRPPSDGVNLVGFQLSQFVPVRHRLRLIGSRLQPAREGERGIAIAKSVPCTLGTSFNLSINYFVTSRIHACRPTYFVGYQFCDLPVNWPNLLGLFQNVFTTFFQCVCVQNVIIHHFRYKEVRY